LASLACAATLCACLGVSSKLATTDGAGGEGAGECEPGATKPAGDGCNTCTCTMERAWSCTDVACPECMTGETMPSGDSCNTCTCMSGRWGCTMKYCSPLVCDQGKADCDGDAANGCETTTATDVMNCGACGYYCGLPSAIAACEAGQCAVDGCEGMRADCNGNPVDGCEAPVGSGGCDGLCNVPTMATEPVPAVGTCECPAGMACVRGSVEDENPDSEYCFPIPEGCPGGFASCGCMSACVCPASSDMASCYDQMAPGGVFILNCPGHPQ
jgi:hypothetical protein